jgi:exonuclease III
MGFAKKRELLYLLRPDVAVVPECSRDAMGICEQEGYSTCWVGDNKNKGLGVLAARPWRLEKVKRPTQKWIVPVRVTGPTNFLLLGVWATRVGEVKELNYIGQIFEAIRKHPRWFTGERPVVICGDFNSNATFDHARKLRNHSAVVKQLAEKGVVSAYHTFFKKEHGQEAHPTHYFWHQKERCFHIDYIFVPREWASCLTNVTVGTYREWRPVSDHVPIVADFAKHLPTRREYRRGA